MAKISNLSKDKPTQFDINHMLKNNIFSTLNCHNIGRILEFDPKTQTCTVEMLQVKQYNAKTFKPAPITNVPLIILGTKNANITFPDPVGTICVLIFMDRNMDSFMETEESYVPSTTRMHDFTDCIALCTFKTLANPITNYDDDAISLVNTGLADEVENTTSLKVYPNLMEVLTNGKVKIANDTQSLAKLMQDFLSACAAMAIDVNTGTLTTESIQNFTNLKTYFAELLSDTGYTGISGGGGSVNTSDTSAWTTLISSMQETNTTLTDLQKSVNSIKNAGYLTETHIFAATGYSKFSSGLIIQWGGAQIGAGSTTVTYPTSFISCSAPIIAFGTKGGTSDRTSGVTCEANNKANFRAHGWYEKKTGSCYNLWIAIGY